MTFKHLLPTLSRTSVFQYTPPLARWYAPSDKFSSTSSPPPSAPTPSSSSPSLPPSRTDQPTSRPRQFFIDLGKKRRAEKARFNEANLILVPVSTGKEVQYSSRELFQEAQEKEKELKKERVRRAGELFDQGKMPEEMRPLVGGRKRPWALSTIRRYLLTHAAESPSFKDLLALNWERFTFDGGELSELVDVEEGLRVMRVENGEEQDYKPSSGKKSADRWQKK